MSSDSLLQRCTIFSAKEKSYGFDLADSAMVKRLGVVMCYFFSRGATPFFAIMAEERL